MGRSKLPQQTLNLRGTARKDRERGGSVSGKRIADIDTAKSLCFYDTLSPQGKEIFERHCSLLIEKDMLEEVYLDTLVLYAQSYDMALFCIDKIGDPGMWYKPKYDRSGKLRGFLENPYLRMFDKVCKTTNEIGNLFGFTPVSRAKIRTESPKTSSLKDILDEINSDPIEIETD